MVAVPADTAITTPPALTVAVPVVPLLHAPPGVASLSAVPASPTDITAVPVIAPAVGSEFTFTTCVAEVVPQLLVTEYAIDVVPVDTPVTKPPAATVAIAVAVLLHAPPPVPPETDSKVVPGKQIFAVPVIEPAVGRAFTVTTLVASTVPQPLVRV